MASAAVSSAADALKADITYTVWVRRFTLAGYLVAVPTLRLLGTNLAEELIPLLIVWLASTQVLLWLLQRQFTVPHINRLHTAYFFLEVAFMLFVAHDVGTVAWIGVFFPIFTVYYANTLLPERQGLLITVLLSTGLAALAGAEGIGMVPHIDVFIRQAADYRDPLVIISTIVLVPVGGYLILAATFRRFGNLQRQTAEQDRERGERLDALLSVADAFGTADDEYSLLRVIARAVLVCVRVDRAAIWVTDSDGKVARRVTHISSIQSAPPVGADQVDVTNPLFNGPLERNQVTIVDRGRGGEHAALAAAYQSETILIVPFSRQEIRGAVSLACSWGHSWSEEEVRTVSALGQQAALALHRAAILRANRSVQASLALSEERHKAISELGSDFAFSLCLGDDGEVRCDWVNEAFTQLTGIRPGSLDLPLLLRAVVHPEDWLQVRAWWLHLIQGRTGTLQVKVLSPTGDTRELRVNARPVLAADEKKVIRINGAAQDITESRKLEAQLRHQALHDPLTQLANRSLLLDSLERALVRVDEQPFALLLIDLDDFKEVNDALGHDVGDEVLRQIAQRLNTLPHGGINHTIARLGGDEFAVLCHGDEELGVQLAVSLRQTLGSPFTVDQHVLSLGSSVGVAVAPRDGRDTATLLRRADIAMYAAKRERHGVRVYDPSFSTDLVENLQLGSDLRHALEAGEMEIHLQPKVTVGGSLRGFEALARWRRADGYVSPEKFIPLAEQSGQIRLLSDWVLAEALRYSTAWQRQGDDLHVSVNLSMRDLQDPYLLPRIQRIIANAPSPRGLMVEVTESSIMSDPARAIRTLARLREWGIQVALDDFGTGYSSFAYLKELPADELKIDRLFVTNLVRDPRDRAIVDAMTKLGQSLGLRVVAEGAEDDENCLALAALGCDLLQGYATGRPLPVPEALALAAAYRQGNIVGRDYRREAAGDSGTLRVLRPTA